MKTLEEIEKRREKVAEMVFSEDVVERIIHNIQIPGYIKTAWGEEERGGDLFVYVELAALTGGNVLGKTGVWLKKET